jgi:hypothetical protein
MITILSGLELEVEISAFGIGGEEGCVLLSGNIEVLIGLSTLSKLPLLQVPKAGGVDRWARGQENASDHAPTWSPLLSPLRISANY